MNALILAKKLGGVIAKNSPTILTGLGVASIIGTSVLTVDATVKATRKVDEINESSNSPLTKREVVHHTWKFYIPAAISGAAGIACVIGSRTVSAKRAAVLSSLYSASEVAAKEYRNKVVEMIGEKKEGKIREAIHEDHIKNNPPEKSKIIATNHGETLFKDGLTGQYFRSSIENVRKVFNKFNSLIISNDCVTQNEWLEELTGETVQGGDMKVFSHDNKLDSNIMDFDRDVVYATAPNGEPCIIIDYRHLPVDYRYFVNR